MVVPVTERRFSFLRSVVGRLAPFALVFLAVQTAVRIAVAIRAIDGLGGLDFEWPGIFAIGFGFDVATLSFLLVPYVLYLVALPRGWHGGRFDRAITSVMFPFAVFAVLFGAVAEWLFWGEFSVRFNFIAVDYLIYTSEVLANIRESYPVIPLLAALFVAGALIAWLLRGQTLPAAGYEASSLPGRALVGGLLLALPTAVGAVLANDDADFSTNNYANELARNGVFSLFAAFRNNEISYPRFYLSEYGNEPLPAIRDLLEEDELGHRFVGSDPGDITRVVPGRGRETRRNVVIVVMESMGADFMARYGAVPGLTPNLDRLAEESVVFDRTYATGTRTVRGLEAITLSIPPLPGRSIVKRPGNENLASLGFVFRDRGYDTRFIYGGYGYFDNMNYFFEHNGFDIVDRSDFADSEQTFANAWGLCDEDVFNKVIAEARKSRAAGHPFMHVVMTTSNHRPYTFPPSRADIPVSGGGRTAGVRYADYAVGRFIEDARREPWFDDTVFVFIADHTAGSAGKAELSVEKYHIPFLVYAPGFATPRTVESVTSQIDLAPTLLGMLDFAYVGRFYGEDVLADFDEHYHAFVANYQRLGYLADKKLVILLPGKRLSAYADGRRVQPSEIDRDLLLKTIAIYTHASQWRTWMKRIDTLPAPVVPRSAG
jgi:phosphoglycerol transferase MdoB-like AlkP superfamily enzyme